MSMLIILALLWGAGVWILVRDLDREQAERQKVERQKALETELRAVYSAAYVDDVVKRRHWELDREADRLAWRIHFREAEHESHIRRFRRMWDGEVA